MANSSYTATTFPTNISYFRSMQSKISSILQKSVHCEKIHFMSEIPFNGRYESLEQEPTARQRLESVLQGQEQNSQRVQAMYDYAGLVCEREAYDERASNEQAKPVNERSVINLLVESGGYAAINETIRQKRLNQEYNEVFLALQDAEEHAMDETKRTAYHILPVYEDEVGGKASFGRTAEAAFRMEKDIRSINATLPRSS